MVSRLLLSYAPLAPVAFVGLLAEGATGPGYRAWRHTVSQRSLGPAWPVDVAPMLLGAAGLLALAIAVPRALPRGDNPRWTPRLIMTAGAALGLPAVFPIDPGVGYPPGQSAVHPRPGRVHGIVRRVPFAALAAAPLTPARHPRGRLEATAHRPLDHATMGSHA